MLSFTKRAAEIEKPLGNSFMISFERWGLLQCQMQE
jgi:hypothetical protein